FLEYAKTELPKGYSIANVYNNHDYIDSLSRVVNSTSIKINEEFLNENHGFPYVSGVDLMPIDFLPRDKEILENECEVIKHLHGLATSIDENALYKDIPEYHGNVAHLEKTLRHSFSRTKPMAQQAEILCQQIMASVDYEEADYAASMGAYATRDNFRAVFPKEYYEKFIYLNYEFLSVPVPLFYNEMLSKVFGNYMKPYRAGGTHDYPVYIRQEEVLIEEIKGVAWPGCDYKKDIKEKEADITGGSKMSEGGEKKDVLFLIAKAANWVFMKKEYEKYINDESFNVYVIPIPYYFRINTMGVGDKVQYEGAALSELVEITGFDKYDFFGKNPDIVYFDTPYDSYDAHMIVYPMFYTDKLRVFAKKLIYVSCILVDDYGEDDGKAKKMMEFCINTPGVARADQVIVQSENMRQRYIDSLTEWAGEDSREVWEKKVISGGVTKEELPEYPRVLDNELSEEWISALSDKDGKRKKVILFYVSISALIENKDNAIKKLREVFNTFRENQDSVILYYHPDNNIDRYLEQFDEKLFIEYRELIDTFISEDFGIYDDSEDDNFMVRLCDGFYGDNGTVMYHCMRAKKPVMVMNYGI
nr:LicD family protein [Lachnospiraceae bacterium]